jgi:hypothetical protein
MKITQDIRGILRAKNNRATCRSCKKRIGKGTPKVEFISSFKQGSQTRVSYVSICWECSISYFEEKIKELQKSGRKFKRMVRNNTKSIKKMKKLNCKLKMLEALEDETKRTN